MWETQQNFNYFYSVLLKLIYLKCACSKQTLVDRVKVLRNERAVAELGHHTLEHKLRLAYPKWPGLLA